MVFNLPDGARPIWIEDGAVKRDGFIMPDGTAYIIDQYGKTIKVNLEVKSKNDQNYRQSEPPVSEHKPGFTMENDNAQAKRPIGKKEIVSGIVFILIILAFIATVMVFISPYFLQSTPQYSQDMIVGRWADQTGKELLDFLPRSSGNFLSNGARPPDTITVDINSTEFWSKNNPVTKSGDIYIIDCTFDDGSHIHGEGRLSSYNNLGVLWAWSNDRYKRGSYMIRYTRA